MTSRLLSSLYSETAKQEQRSLRLARSRPAMLVAEAQSVTKEASAGLLASIDGYQRWFERRTWVNALPEPSSQRLERLCQYQTVAFPKFVSASPHSLP